MNKRVAVITRTKNRAFLLRRALESVLSQTHEDWVHVIVNDGGDRESVDALLKQYEERYAGRLKVVHNARSVGMEAASNIGIEGSESSYIAIHDDDDSWHADFLSVCVEVLESTPFKSIKGVTTHTLQVFERITGEKTVIETSRREFDPTFSAISLPEITETNKFMPISFLYRRDALTEVGVYDESLPVVGDWEFNIRFLSRFDVQVVKRNLANYHIRVDESGDYANSVTIDQDKHQLYRALIVNKYIREDLQGRNVSLGMLMACGDYFQRMGRYTWRLVQILDRLKRLAPVRFLRKWV